MVKVSCLLSVIFPHNSDSDMSKLSQGPQTNSLVVQHQISLSGRPRNPVNRLGIHLGVQEGQDGISSVR